MYKPSIKNKKLIPLYQDKLVKIFSHTTKKWGEVTWVFLYDNYYSDWKSHGCLETATTPQILGIKYRLGNNYFSTPKEIAKWYKSNMFLTLLLK